MIMLQYFLLSLIHIQKIIHCHFHKKIGHRQSDDIFEAVGGVAGQPLALTAATQVLAVRTPNVNMPLLPLTAAARSCTYLSIK